MNENGGGIHAVGLIIKAAAFENKTAIIFHSNSVEKGDGLYMEVYAKLYVFQSCLHYSKAVSFTDNSAEYGGAVYVDDGTYFATCNRQDIECFVQVISANIPIRKTLHSNIIPCYQHKFETMITFKNNNATTRSHGPSLFMRSTA